MGLIAGAGRVPGLRGGGGAAACRPGAGAARCRPWVIQIYQFYVSFVQLTGWDACATVFQAGVD
jgi:hypothetical protein